MNEECMSLIKNLDLFAEMGDEELALIYSVAKTKSVKKNTLLLSKGDENRTMYIIKNGSVDVSIYTESGKELILTTLHKGDYFGELSLLDGMPISTNITLSTDSEFVFLHKEDFLGLINDHSSIAIHLIRNLCKKIRELTEKAEGFALKDVYERFTRLLMDISEESANGERVITTPMTHKSIALRIGSSREMVSRVMKELEVGGYISTQHKIITIKKKLPAAW